MNRLSVRENSRKSRLEKIPSIDIEFEDLSYFVGNSKAGRKQILKSINGKFFSGQLSVIIGSSSAGKTSLLNVLAGYVLNGIQGNIKLNGRLRQMETFHRLSNFIMQENLIQPYLTVKEEMMIAAHFKLGNRVHVDDKLATVDEVLALLGLGDCIADRVENLSGGQKKRLSIALDLIGNPPVIFLDDPTTGLDTVAMKQCIDVFKTLTDNGKTVICTINQPSVSIMEKFDQVYFLANGMCVYNGLVSKIPRFLSALDLECPLTYSHAEYVIEIVETNPDFIPLLVKTNNNGKNYVVETSQNLVTDNSYAILSQRTLSPTSFWTQLYVLLYRMMLQETRNKMSFWIRFLSHTLVGLFLGTLFFGIGNDATQVVTNFKMCMCMCIFLVYCYMIAPVMLLPFEMKVLKREYFNRWYGLKAYYLAVTLRNVPLLVFFVLEFSLIIYFMTNQPLDFVRLFKFSVTVIMTCLIAEGIGLGIGTILDSMSGSIVGVAIIVPCIILSVHGIGYMDQVVPFMKVMMGTSFIRPILVAMNLALYKNRDQLLCSDEILYCDYKNPHRILKDLGALHASYGFEVLTMTAFLVFFRLIAYILLRLRLNPERCICFNHFVPKIKKL